MSPVYSFVAEKVGHKHNVVKGGHDEYDNGDGKSEEGEEEENVEESIKESGEERWEVEEAEKLEHY